MKFVNLKICLCQRHQNFALKLGTDNVTLGEANEVREGGLIGTGGQLVPRLFLEDACNDVPDWLVIRKNDIGQVINRKIMAPVQSVPKR